MSNEQHIYFIENKSTWYWNKIN